MKDTRQLNLPLDLKRKNKLGLTEKVQRILALMDEKNEDGAYKYQDSEIAKIIGCTRQYISYIRTKHGRPPAWEISPRKVTNRLSNLNAKELDGLTFDEISQKLGIGYHQAQYLCRLAGIKYRRKASPRPASSKLPSVEELYKQNETHTWDTLAKMYGVSLMTMFRYLKGRKK